MTKKPLDILVLVNREDYWTPEDYIDEALRLGCFQKVKSIPKWIKAKTTRIYLCHRENAGSPVLLFGWYVVDGVVQCSDQSVYDEVSGGIHITTIGPNGMDRTQPRRYGEILIPGEFGLVGPDDQTVRLGLRPPTGQTGRINLIKPMLSLGPMKHFRGFRYVTLTQLVEMISEDNQTE